MEQEALQSTSETCLVIRSVYKKLKSPAVDCKGVPKYCTKDFLPRYFSGRELPPKLPEPLEQLRKGGDWPRIPFYRLDMSIDELSDAAPWTLKFIKYGDKHIIYLAEIKGHAQIGYTRTENEPDGEAEWEYVKDWKCLPGDQIHN
ncbi:hypothetical protein BFJ63_vAg17782 [Fusarium oxysporum f. sp. narcissi]|uniref:Uncharacterized protein n=1 Tax=Fusarium oxysporum f. sp. narcissi TaxID=451672 RepID=A0A4Q2V003_FUSOX|nr:hypothetical protein BFJ63_vAg17782 [Fusarium oxysporum f. sp. narcissi]